MEHWYNVVWADDEIDALLKDNGNLFKRNGINIIPFAAAKPAIDYIRGHHQFVDAIIVDAKFSRDGEAFKEEGRSFPGLSLFMKELTSLRNEFKMPYPCWIFTGYGDLLRDKYDREDLDGFEEEIIRKGANYYALREWVESICEKISYTRSDEFKIRQENSQLFELCTESYLGTTAQTRLYQILTYKGKNESNIFNAFRGLLEEIMDLLVRKNLIGDQTTKTAINARIKELGETYSLPQYVIPSLKLLLISSPLSHSGTEDDIIVEDGKAPFLYEAMLNTLKNILIWVKTFVDTVKKNTATKPDSDTAIENKNYQTGHLTISVNLGKDGFASVGDNIKIENNWKSGTPLKVITEKNQKGKLVVKEIIVTGR